jgi:hypothetical protein
MWTCTSQKPVVDRMRRKQKTSNLAGGNLRALQHAFAEEEEQILCALQMLATDIECKQTNIVRTRLSCDGEREREK